MSIESIDEGEIWYFIQKDVEKLPYFKEK